MASTIPSDAGPTIPTRRPGLGALMASQAAPPVAVAVLVALALSALSGTQSFAELGLPDPGPVTTYGLPVMRGLAEAAGVLTVGFLVHAAFFCPPAGVGWLAGDGYRAVRAATWSAVVWAAAAAVTVPLSLADAYGRPLGDVLDPRVLVASVPGISAAGAWLLTALAGLLVAGLGRATLSWGPTACLAALAVLGQAPVALTGHSSSGGAHDIAMTSLLWHAVAAAVWVGGLVAVLVHVRAGGDHPGTAVRRFSRTALVCWVILAVSGVANALLRVTPADLVTSTYGALVLAKIVGLVALGVMGAWHRARTIPAVERGSPGALLRLGGVEALLMFATVGVAVALGRTPPPPGSGGAEPARVESLLGYDLEPLTALRLLTAWRFDLAFGTVALVLAGLYLVGVRRLRRRGDAWPVGRTVAWLVGCLVLLLATSSGVGRYAPALFSVHMGQHMLLAMLAPILLVLGAPTTLLLRVVPPARGGEPPGPREWVLTAVRSPVARFLTHPLIALALFVGSFYVLYFSGLFDAAVSTHWAHLLMNAHFLLVGYLFFWPIIGIDPSPRTLPYPARLGLLMVSVPLHAFFGIAVMSSEEVIGALFYSQLALPWVDRLADQSTGGGLAWAAGEAPVLLVLVALLVQWSRSDEREGRRHDRQADRDGDRALGEYNAMLRGSPVADAGPRAPTQGRTSTVGLARTPTAAPPRTWASTRAAASRLAARAGPTGRAPTGGDSLVTPR